MVRMSVFERTLVDVWLKKMRKMLIATHNITVHEKDDQYLVNTLNHMCAR